MIGDSALGARRRATRRARSDGERTSGHLREVFAGSQSAQYELQATTAALTPMPDGSVPWVHRAWVAVAFLLGAISRDVPGDPDAVRPTLERALDLAEADQLLLPRLTPQAPGPPERPARHPAAPAAWICEIIDLLAQASDLAATPAEPARPGEALTRCEARVLRYLPTHLSTREIADGDEVERAAGRGRVADREPGRDEHRVAGDDDGEEGRHDRDRQPAHGQGVVPGGGFQRHPGHRRAGHRDRHQVGEAARAHGGGQDPADRRARRIVATTRGWALLDGLGERLRAAEDQVLAGLDDDEDRQAFRALLQRLAVYAATSLDSAALNACTAERATATQSCQGVSRGSSCLSGVDQYGA